MIRMPKERGVAAWLLLATILTIHGVRQAAAQSTWHGCSCATACNYDIFYGYNWCAL